MDVIQLRQRTGKPLPEYTPQQPALIDERAPALRRLSPLRRMISTVTGVLGVALGASLVLMGGVPATLVLGGGAVLAGMHKIYAGLRLETKNKISIFFTGNPRSVRADIDTPMKKAGRFLGNVALAGGGVMATLTGMAISSFGGTGILLAGLTAGGAVLAVSGGISVVRQVFSSISSVVSDVGARVRDQRERSILPPRSTLPDMQISDSFRQAADIKPSALHDATPSGPKPEAFRL